MIVRSGRGLGRRLADLKAWRVASAGMEQRGYVQEAARVHAAANKEWRRLPAVDEGGGASTRPWLRRKKFLVLVGPTGMGKTEFVKALFGPAKTLEINAAGMQHPCLRDYESNLHVCILWDEAEASLVAKNRKLFQCPAAFVGLGHSPTGAFGYQVMVNRSVMVINSNRWHEQLQSLPTEDRKWIEGNQVAVEVTAPLWVTEE